MILTIVIAVFLAFMALQPAQALEPEQIGWQADCRRDRILKEFNRGDDQAEIDIVNPEERKDEKTDKILVVIPLDKAARAELEKALREFKKCDRFYKCLEDRDAGKVKHCYENDRRWR